MAFRVAFYKGTRPGIPGVYNRAVRAWTQGPYSHVELVFSDGWSASSSFEDGGVRFKRIDYAPARWDFIELPAEWEPYALEYFEQRNHKVRYDLVGNLHFVIGLVGHSAPREFCSESVAGALRFEQPWRYHPNTLYSAVSRAVLAHHSAKNLSLRTWALA